MDYNLDNIIIIHRCISTHFKNKGYDCIRDEYHLRGHNTYVLKAKKKSYAHYKAIEKKFTTISEIKLFFIVCSLHNIHDIYKILCNFEALQDQYRQKIFVYKHLPEVFKKDIKFLKTKYTNIKNTLVKYNDKDCGLLHSVQTKDINIETLIILDYICNILQHIDKVEKNNIVWKEEKYLYHKYKSFIENIDTEYFKQLLTES